MFRAMEVLLLELLDPAKAPQDKIINEIRILYGDDIDLDASSGPSQCISNDHVRL